MLVPKSRSLMQRARQYMPGGVNSPVRSFKAVGGDPLFIAKGAGPYIWDVDDNKYLDYVASWGPLIHGHSHPHVVEAIQKTAVLGTSFGAPTEGEIRLTQMIVEALPSVEMVRLVNSGTEATMSAIRLARGATGREKIVKFAGCYHGHADGLLAKAGSGLATFGVPDSPGVPLGMAQQTITLPYNDLDTITQFMNQYGGEIAAIIVEPVAGNMGVIPPQEGFLAGLRQLTNQTGSLLIFDEVITGFRVAYGGAQDLYGIKPDLTCLGKIIGGGLPVGAYGGRRDLMEQMAPVGLIYQAGTLAGNPLAVAAGIATLELLQTNGVYENLSHLGKILAQGFQDAAKKAHIPVQVNRVGCMMTMFFTQEPVQDYASAVTSSAQFYGQFFHKLLIQGVYLAPSQFEACFVSTVHTMETVEFTIDAAGQVLRQLQ